MSGLPTSLEMLLAFIEERNDADPSFVEKARHIAVESLESNDPILVCTGIQVLCAVGNDADLDMVKGLIDDPEESITKNARCCLFERGIKVKKPKP